MLLRTSTSICLFLALFVVGCARSAPPLPSSTSNSDETKEQVIARLPITTRNINCKEIFLELEGLKEHDSKLSIQIQGNRGTNQAAGYIGGVLFLPALLAVENDKSAKAMLDQNQYRRDQLIVAQWAKSCPSN